MTTSAPETTTSSDHRTCGCCGESRPAAQVTELGSTPGVYICFLCALWAAVRISKFPVVALAARRVLRRLRRVEHGHSGAVVLSAIPILPSSDLDRTTAHYTSLGFQLVERHDGYLVMHSTGVELHFSAPASQRTTGEAFLHVTDAGALWQRLMSKGVDGLGPVSDQPYGLREFIATDPDGNCIRLGSGIEDD